MIKKIISFGVITLSFFYCTVERKQKVNEQEAPSLAHEKMLKDLKEDSIRKIEADREEKTRLQKQGIFGKWYCALRHYESTIYFKKIGNNYTAIVDFDDPRSKNKIEILRKEGNSYFKSGETSDYYVIKPNGNLELRDVQGLLSTAINIMPK